MTYTHRQNDLVVHDTRSEDVYRFRRQLTALSSIILDFYVVNVKLWASFDAMPSGCYCRADVFEDHGKPPGIFELGGSTHRLSRTRNRSTAMGADPTSQGA